MIIKSGENNNIEELISFSWSHCSSNKTRSFPLFTSKDEIKEKILSRMDDSNNEILGCYEDNKLIGVLLLDVIPNDYYLQTSAFYIEEANDEVGSVFINYIENNYPNYSCFIGLTKENQILTQLLKNNQFELIDDSLMMEINIKDIEPKITANKTIKVGYDELDEYLKFHKKHFESAYWNSVRIKEKFNEWDIFEVKEMDTIKGGTFIKNYKNNSSEIFGIWSEDSSVYDVLVNGMLAYYKFNKSKVEKIIIMVEISETALVEVLKENGFKIENTYCCFKKIIKKKD